MILRNYVTRRSTIWRDITYLRNSTFNNNLTLLCNSTFDVTWTSGRTSSLPPSQTRALLRLERTFNLFGGRGKGGRKGRGREGGEGREGEGWEGGKGQ